MSASKKLMSRFKAFSLLMVLSSFCQNSFASEGPYLSEGVPWARLSGSGSLQIMDIVPNANCYGNKINVSEGEDADFRKMVLSLVTSAQISQKRIKVWVERYAATTPQRCKIAYIEIEPNTDG